MTFDYLSNATSPATLATAALLVGLAVRALKSRPVSAVLDWLPVSWIHAIPPRALPWLAIALGVVLIALDARLNGGVGGWSDALHVGLAGILAGGTAVGGHETVTKLLRAEPPAEPPPNSALPAEPLPPPNSALPPPNSGRDLVSWLSCSAIACVAVACCLTATPGCAALGALPAIIAVILDGSQVIDAIATFIARWFSAHPDPAAQAKVDLAVARCRSTLNIALRIAQGTAKLDESKVDAAFDDFKRAYLELLGLVRPYGVRQSTDAPTLNSDGGSLVVPPPLALHPRARR